MAKNIIDEVRPGDTVKVTIRNRSRFGGGEDKVGIGYIYSNGGVFSNATLFASIAWSDGGCSNSLLNKFDSIEKIKITK
jgi:hypothetical protein